MHLERDCLQLFLLIGVLLALTKPLGCYLEKVFEYGDRYEDQPWTTYAVQLLAFSAMSVVFNYVIVRLQHRLPLNPQGFAPLPPHLSLNVAIGFITGTAWTSYVGESSLSYFSQMVGLTFQNFSSAATGICAAVAVIRGLSRSESAGVGNFWVDLTKCTLCVLLPMCFIFSLLLMSQGVVQNFLPTQEALTLEGARQLIAQGPAASQVAIKLLGSNGEGFFNANAAHPYENPTAFSNFLQILGMLLVPSALLYYFGRAVKNTRHAWSVWIAMLILLVGGALLCASFEYKGNPVLKAVGCAKSANMEGKETRFGIFNSALFATVTTDTSCGATNAGQDSFTPLGGLVPLVNMKLGEVVFGGVGSGLYGMIGCILLTVFVAGLLIGRTPEYLGKKVEGREMKYVMFVTVATAALTLAFSAWAVSDPRGTSALGNEGAHGFSEILYAYTSGANNNGSSFAGLSTNTPFWNLTLAFVMFFGRFFTMLPMLAVAGAMAKKKTHPGGAGTFQPQGGLFIALLLAVLLIVGALTYLPALALGPIIEHFGMGIPNRL